MATHEKIGCFLKAGFQGSAGTGKSTTAGLLLLGLSVSRHNKAPVLVFDTEPGWQFLRPLYQAEGVDLIIESGRHFKGMHDAITDAVKRGCCGFAVDSITHTWSELLERFADSTGRVPFHKFNQIKPLWNDWTIDFLNAPLHAIANGRLGFEYFYEEQEDGKKELVKGDTKMKAGGGESFGYEPHLTCEMNHQRKKLRGKLGGLEYVCFVLKDRVRALNGKEFTFADLQDYKVGDYRHVLKAFLPHLEALENIAGVNLPKSTSAALIPNGDTQFHQKQRVKQGLLEEWYATMDLLFSTRTDEGKHHRMIVTEAITSVRSKTKFESFDAAQLQYCVMVLMQFEKRLKAEPTKEDGNLRSLVEMAKEDMKNGKESAETLVERKLKESIAQENLKQALEVNDEDMVPF